MAKKKETPLEAYRAQEEKVRECEEKVKEAKARLTELEPAMRQYVAEENAKQLEKYKDAAMLAAQQAGADVDVTPDFVAAAVAAYVKQRNAPAGPAGAAGTGF